MEKHNTLKRPLTFAALALLFLAAGCAEPQAVPPPAAFSAGTPREAVMQAFQDDTGPIRDVGNPENAVVMQEQPVRDDVVFALLSFQAARDNGQPMDCLYYYGVKRAAGGWSAKDFGGGCRPLGLPEDGSPIQVGQAAGWSSDPQALTFSLVYGPVFDDQIRAVEVTWDDGGKQRVAVANQTFLAVRLAEHELTQVEALDQDGMPVFTYALE